MKKRILLVLENSPLNGGGIERHCRNLLHLFEEDEDIQMDVLSKEDLPYFILGNKNVCHYKSLVRLLKEGKYSAVHVHGFASVMAWQALRAAQSLGIKNIYTAHYHPFYTLDNPMLGRLFFYTLLRSVVRRVDMIITLNKEDTAFFRRYNSHVQMIPHWLDSMKESSEERKSSNMLLFVGRIDGNKGLEYLYSLPIGLYKIHCVTDGVIYRSDFIVHRNISDMELAQLYHQAALVIVPSRYEAFSYVALEALSSGTPVVMSNRVRIADYLKGVEGVRIFPYGSVDAFQEAVAETVGSQVDVSAVQSVFAPERIKSQMKNIYV